MKQYISSLKATYKDKYPTQIKHPKFLKAKPKEYIRLALVHKASDVDGMDDNEFQDLLSKGKVKEACGLKTPLKMDEIAMLQDGSIARRALIEGRPGIGKTTFSWELCRQWVAGEILQQFSILLLVQLSGRKGRNAKNLKDIFFHSAEAAPIGVYESIMKNNGEGVFIIFEGYDETSSQQLSEESIISQILNKEVLQDATILVTTRPAGIQDLPSNFLPNLDQHVEVLGFDEHDIEQYIESACLGQSDLLDDFKYYLSSHPFIASVMYIPLQCAIITELYTSSWKKGSVGFAPKTLTELYTALASSLILRHLLTSPTFFGRFKNSDFSKMKRLSDLPPDIYEQLAHLAELAAKGIENHEYVFSDGPCDTMGLMQEIEDNEAGGLVSSTSYNFLHLTLQEYLAAFHWSHLEYSQFIELVTRPGMFPINALVANGIDETTGHHWPSLLFLSGLTQLKAIPNELITKLFESDSDEPDILQRNVFHSSLCQLMFEAHNPTLVAQLFRNGRFQPLCSTPFDWYVTGYCMSHTSASASWVVYYSSEHGDKQDHVDKLVSGLGKTTGRIDGMNISCNEDMLLCLENLSPHTKGLKTLILDFTNTRSKDSLEALKQVSIYYPKLEVLCVITSDANIDWIPQLHHLQCLHCLHTLEIQVDNVVTTLVMSEKSPSYQKRFSAFQLTKENHVFNCQPPLLSLSMLHSSALLKELPQLNNKIIALQLTGSLPMEETFSQLIQEVFMHYHEIKVLIVDTSDRVTNWTTPLFTAIPRAILPHTILLKVTLKDLVSLESAERSSLQEYLFNFKLGLVWHTPCMLLDLSLCRDPNLIPVDELTTLRLTGLDLSSNLSAKIVQKLSFYYPQLKVLILEMITDKKEPDQPSFLMSLKTLSKLTALTIYVNGERVVTSITSQDPPVLLQDWDILGFHLKDICINFRTPLQFHMSAYLSLILPVILPLYIGSVRTIQFDSIAPPDENVVQSLQGVLVNSPELEIVSVQASKAVPNVAKSWEPFSHLLHKIGNLYTSVLLMDGVEQRFIVCNSETHFRRSIKTLSEDDFHVPFLSMEASLSKAVLSKVHQLRNRIRTLKISGIIQNEQLCRQILSQFTKLELLAIELLDTGTTTESLTPMLKSLQAVSLQKAFILITDNKQVCTYEVSKNTHKLLCVDLSLCPALPALPCCSVVQLAADSLVSMDTCNMTSVGKQLISYYPDLEVLLLTNPAHKYFDWTGILKSVDRLLYLKKLYIGVEVCPTQKEIIVFANGWCFHYCAPLLSTSVSCVHRLVTFFPSFARKVRSLKISGCVSQCKEVIKGIQQFRSCSSSIETVVVEAIINQKELDHFFAWLPKEKHLNVLINADLGDVYSGTQGNVSEVFLSHFSNLDNMKPVHSVHVSGRPLLVFSGEKNSLLVSDPTPSGFFFGRQNEVFHQLSYYFLDLKVLVIDSIEFNLWDSLNSSLHQLKKLDLLVLILNRKLEDVCAKIEHPLVEKISQFLCKKESPLVESKFDVRYNHQHQHVLKVPYLALSSCKPLQLLPEIHTLMKDIEMLQLVSQYNHALEGMLQVAAHCSAIKTICVETSINTEELSSFFTMLRITKGQNVILNVDMDDAHSQKRRKQDIKEMSVLLNAGDTDSITEAQQEGNIFLSKFTSLFDINPVQSVDVSGIPMLMFSGEAKTLLLHENMARKTLGIGQAELFQQLSFYFMDLEVLVIDSTDCNHWDSLPHQLANLKLLALLDHGKPKVVLAKVKTPLVERINQLAFQLSFAPIMPYLALSSYIPLQLMPEILSFAKNILTLQLSIDGTHDSGMEYKKINSLLQKLTKLNMFVVLVGRQLELLFTKMKPCFLGEKEDQCRYYPYITIPPYLLLSSYKPLQSLPELCTLVKDVISLQLNITHTSEEQHKEINFLMRHLTRQSHFTLYSKELAVMYDEYKSSLDMCQYVGNSRAALHLMAELSHVISSIKTLKLYVTHSSEEEYETLPDISSHFTSLEHLEICFDHVCNPLMLSPSQLGSVKFLKLSVKGAEVAFCSASIPAMILHQNLPVTIALDKVEALTLIDCQCPGLYSKENIQKWSLYYPKLSSLVIGASPLNESCPIAATQAVCALADVLIVCKMLKTVSLSDENVGSEGVLALAKALIDSTVETLELLPKHYEMFAKSGQSYRNLEDRIKVITEHRPIKLYLEPKDIEPKEDSETSSGKTGNVTAQESDGKLESERDGNTTMTEGVEKKVDINTIGKSGHVAIENISVSASISVCSTKHKEGKRESTYRKDSNATAIQEGVTAATVEKSRKEESRQSAKQKCRIPILSKGGDMTISNQGESIDTLAGKGASSSATQESSSPSLDEVSKIDKPFTDIHLTMVAAEITDWKELADNFSLDESQQLEIAQEYPGQGLQQKVAMLHKWKEEKGKDATYKEVIRVLTDAGKHDVADKIQELLQLKQVKTGR